MELVTRAFAAFEVKSIDSNRRTFSGWATTPSIDRVGDSVDPLGVRFTNPVKLLHGHMHSLPIGNAIFGKPTKKGVEFDAEIPVVEDGYGSLKDRVDTAWGELKYGLVSAVSIGFRALKYNYTDHGVDYDEIEVYELSTVAIPALPDAVITAVKSMGHLPDEFVKHVGRICCPRDPSAPVRLIKHTAPKENLNGAVRLIRS